MILANGKIKKIIFCPNCFAKVSWTDSSDEHTHIGERYILCPNCGSHIDIDEGVTTEETGIVENPTATINGRAATITDIARPSEGATVKLTEDTIIDASAPAAARFSILKNGSTLDLNGKTLETAGQIGLASGGATAEIKGGTIKASAGTTSTVLINANGGKEKKGKLILTDIIIEAPTKNALQVNNGAELVLNNVTITAPGNGKAQSGIGIDVESDGKVIAKNVKITAKEAAIWNTQGKGNISIEGGELSADNNAVIMTNGIAGHGKNDISINGATINAKQPAITEYIACGIYVANDDTVSIKNSTINAENGVGILVRGGSVSIDKNTTINAAGSGSGLVGDSKVQIAMGQNIVIDKTSNYPAAETISVTVDGKLI